MSLESRSCQHHVNYTCMNGQHTAPDANFLCASSCEASTQKSSGENAHMDASYYSRQQNRNMCKTTSKRVDRQRWLLAFLTGHREAHLSVLGGLLGKVGGCILGVRLLDDIGSGVHSKADKAGHVEGLHDAVPAVPPEPLIIPWHVLASRDHVGLVALHHHKEAIVGT